MIGLVTLNYVGQDYGRKFRNCDIAYAIIALLIFSPGPESWVSFDQL